MKQDSARRGEAGRARMRQLREQYHRRLIAAIIICFVLGAVAGVFAHRWYVSRTPRDVVVTPSPVAPTEPTPTPDAEAPGLFLEDEDGGAAAQDAFPEVEEDGADAIFPETAEDGGEDAIFPEDAGENEVEALPDETAEAANADAAQATEAPAEEAGAPEANGDAGEAVEAVTDGETATTAEAPTDGETATTVEAPTDGETATTVEAPTDGETATTVEAPTDEEAAITEEAATTGNTETAGNAEATVNSEEAAATPEATAEPEATEAPAGPQVIAIVPYGESFTYTTQIDADGNARVDAGDGAYETLSFTQTMKSFMRPTDFADQYAKTYKLSGDEAGAGFELVLNDYTGEATIVPQNIIDISMRSESGDTVERGYQLMDAPIDGNYGIALNTNTPKLLYKRFPYSDTEEMAYLVVTTYNDGVSQMILFEVERDEAEVEEEIVYPILQKGLVGDAVAAMQTRLIELGYLKGTADGTFGDMTDEAIRKAQEAFGMEINGIADNAFQQKLYEGVEPVAAPEGAENYETLNQASTGELVVKLQLRLRELGYYDGRADGGYGPKTIAAVKRAQAAFGMAETGIADGAFQARLYAGAEPDPTAEPTPEPTPDNVAGENTVG